MRREVIIKNLIEMLVILNDKEDISEEVLDLLNIRIMEEKVQVNVPIEYLEKLQIQLEERILLRL